MVGYCREIAALCGCHSRRVALSSRSVAACCTSSTRSRSVLGLCRELFGWTCGGLGPLAEPAKLDIGFRIRAIPCSVFGPLESPPCGADCHSWALAGPPTSRLSTVPPSLGEILRRILPARVVRGSGGYSRSEIEHLPQRFSEPRRHTGVKNSNLVLAAAFLAAQAPQARPSSLYPVNRTISARFSFPQKISAPCPHRTVGIAGKGSKGVWWRPVPQRPWLLTSNPD